MGNPLKSQVVTDLLDKNDQIRDMIGPTESSELQNLLPSIVVVGAQSHGKSSVLEAASHVKLPAGTGMVTKRPLIMQLRSAFRQSTKFQARTSEQQKNLDVDSICQAIVDETRRSDKEQQDEGNHTGVVDLPMTLRIESDSCPNVTMIDLPGIKYDSQDAGARIKSMIRTYIDASSAIILVVHNATVDTDTNEGFKMAKDVDPAGARTLCVLTHVDMIQDTEMMKANVLSKLDDPETTYIAVRNPSPSEHDTITFKQSRHKEREYFATNGLINPVKYKDQLGTDALLRKVEVLYCKAVRDSQKPLRQKVFEVRYNIENELVQCPNIISPQLEFSQLWFHASMIMDEVVKNPKEHLTFKGEIHRCCETLANDLHRVPESYLDPNQTGRSSMVKLVECLRFTDGIMLPNYTPYGPIEQFIRENVQRYASEAIDCLRGKLSEQLKLIATEVMIRVRDKKPNSEYQSCFELIDEEMMGVLAKINAKFNVRLSEILKDETSCIWTSNTPVYVDILNKGSICTDEQFLEVFGENEQVMKMLTSNDALREQVKNYFCTFTSYWKVFANSFIDGIGKCAIRTLNELNRAMTNHEGEVNYDHVERQLETVMALGKRRDALRAKLTRLEEAQKLLDGKVTPIPQSIIDKRDHERDHGTTKMKSNDDIDRVEN